MAPIVLFLYNRPWHTQQTLDALANNDLAIDSELYLYCDGPKLGDTKEMLSAVSKTRTIAKNENRFRKVTVVEAESNKGLAESIIDGVTEIVNQYGKIIVLEDDIVTSPGFLNFMNDSLDLYQNDEKVMHVSGYMYPVKKELPETFFIRPTSCWGWATWKRAWHYFDKDVGTQIDKINKNNGWKEFTIDSSNPSYKNQLYLNKEGKIDTWAIFWQASVFLKRGLSLHPYPSLVQNIGFDGSGVHCESNDLSPYVWGKIGSYIVPKRIRLRVHSNSYKALKLYFMEINKIKDKNSLRDNFYLFRQKKINQLKDLYKILFHYDKLHIVRKKENNKIDNQQTIERYKEGVTKFKNINFHYVDFASFQSTVNELFKQKIYSFKTNKKTPLIIDCGANIGLSILFFKELYPDCKITAFEADPKVFSVLLKNVEQFKDIQLINKALWDSETKLQFYSEGADGGRIDSKIFGVGKLTEVETTSLRGYLNNKVDFLKIDIEGAEFKVLNNCKDLLVNVENLFVEYHSFENDSQNLGEILMILKSAGFRYYLSSIGVKSQMPLIERNQYIGMDNQMNIFAYR